jgi:hypothetical protein
MIGAETDAPIFRRITSTPATPAYLSVDVANPIW